MYKKQLFRCLPFSFTRPVSGAPSRAVTLFPSKLKKNKEAFFTLVPLRVRTYVYRVRIRIVYIVYIPHTVQLCMYGTENGTGIQDTRTLYSVYVCVLLFPSSRPDSRHIRTRIHHRVCRYVNVYTSKYNVPAYQVHTVRYNVFLQSSISIFMSNVHRRVGVTSPHAEEGDLVVVNFFWLLVL